MELSFLFHLLASFFFNLWNRILFIACMHNLVYYNSKLVFFFENDEKKNVCSGITLATIILDFNDAR